MITLATGLILAVVATSIPTNNISSVTELAAALSVKSTERQPFDLEATITHIRPIPGASGSQSFNIALNNGDNAVVLLQHENVTKPLEPGDRIRCKGHVEIHNRLTRARITEPITVIAHGKKPEPTDLSIPKLLKGNYEYAFVRIKGRVYDARPSETNKRYLLLSLVDANSLVAASAYVTEEEARHYTDLIGTEVCVEGVYSTNDGIRHHIGGNIKLANFSSIKVIRPANDDDPDTPPLKALDNCNADDIPLLVRHYAIGRVTAIMDSRALVLTPEGRHVCAELIGTARPALGSTIKATGFPDTDLVNVNLIRATWKTAACMTPEESPTMAATAAMLKVDTIGYRLTKLYGKRVSLSGTVFTPPGTTRHSGILHVISDGITFQVYAPYDDIARISDGTTIRAIGSYMLDSESWHKQETTPKIHGFIIITRTPDDILVISTPPWWTLSRLLVVICTLLLCIIAITIWNRMLSKLADRRGKQLLKAQLAGVRSQMKVLERTRLAVELHDSIAQNLTAVAMELTTAELLGEGAPPDMRDHLGIARQTLKSCREELRNCIWDLRSNALEEMNIEKAISLALNPIAKKSKIAIRFPVSRRHVPDSVMHAVLRIIRELCANGITHGKASALRIAGKLDNGTLMFSIDDNGIGFDPENHPGVQEGHFGIQGIRERLLHLKGCISFFSAKGKGCKVRVEIPVNDDEEELPA